ncbi:hypothetical protein M8C21_025743 [Ambrosia artemisiifolia]|uniref:Uncharacterized protein n=1 Tax=Ambrosia artemisiifolia TaxID=4212 RepID=A0AAD5C6D6_AMBAR|nr:hypothetical protein M8C21_025743 [Ambrosia artemisiifolia]
MKKTFDARGVALFLVINLILHNVLQVDSAHQGTMFSGRNRMLRKVSSAPPSPKLGKHIQYRRYPRPPPPLSSLQNSGIASSSPPPESA